MFGKLIAILAHAKGAVVTTVLLAGAATATVTVSSNPEVQNTFDNVTTSLSSTLGAVMQNAKKCTDADAGGGQPEVVAQRNAADKLLRDAWNDDHKKLTQMRGGKDVDNKAVGDVVKTYDDQLKATLDNALVKVAALTQGRDGLVRKAPQDGSGSASAPGDGSSSGAPRDGSGSAKPTCPPTPAPGTNTTTSNTAPRDGSGSAGGPSDGSGSAKGRVAVANRTTLTADLKAIVDQATKDMDAIVKKATDEAAKLTPAPANGGKPEDKGKPSDKPGNGNKPTTRP